MLCATCGQETERISCTACGGLAALAQRYRLDRMLGRDATGLTYQGRDLRTRQVVVVKEVPLEDDAPPGAVEGFAAEVERLCSLAHPGLCRYLDAVVEPPRLFAVHAYVDGWTLEEERAVRRHDEAAVLAVLEPLAETLIWLHELRPALVHGGVHPGNVIRHADDGRILLVDPGSPRLALRGPLDRRPLPGRPGYLAPEQRQGEVGPASDRYALGATALALIGGAEPDALLQDRWRERLDLSTDLEHLLLDLLEADPRRRPSDEEVLRRIRALRR